MALRRMSGHSRRRQAVIFDFDGTIADSFEYVFEFLVKEARNTTVYSAEELKVLRMLAMKDLALRLGVPVWRLPLTFFKGRRVMRARMERVEPVPGMVEVIRQLHTDGYMLFIASSNSGRNIKHLLRRHGILGCFRSIRGGAGISGKAAMIRRMLVRYRLPKENVWYVGDEAADVRSAERAGVRCMAVRWGFADPEKMIKMAPEAFANKPADIVRIIEKSWKK